MLLNLRKTPKGKEVLIRVTTSECNSWSSLHSHSCRELDKCCAGRIERTSMGSACLNAELQSSQQDRRSKTTYYGYYILRKPL